MSAAAQDVLEFLDLNGGQAYVTELARRGVSTDDVSGLERDGLVKRDDTRVVLTDAGAAAMEGLPEPAQAPAAEPPRTRSNGHGKVTERILSLLAECPEGIRAKAIHERLGISQGSAASALSKLRKSGQAASRNMDGGAFYFAAVNPPAEPKVKAPAKRRSAVPPATVDPVTASSDVDRYLSILGRMAALEAPPGEVLDRLERVLELDALVRAS